MWEAGFPDDADDLLRAELHGTHAPYYFMQNLAENARKRGEPGAVVNWYEQAWQAATGPATRLQWGASYLLALVEHAPRAQARREALAEAYLAEVRSTPDAFCQRNRSQMQKVATVLGAGAYPSQPHSDALRAAVEAGLNGPDR